MASKTAIIFGATGLIGSYVLEALAHDDRYSKILVFARNPLKSSYPKVTVTITDLKSDAIFTNAFAADEIYCCLGTTIRKAGSREAFRVVDYDLPLRICKAARQNKIPKMLVVSSLGADAQSGNFYLHTKGEMEEALQAVGISSLYFFRPSMLLGPRKESRPGETVGKILMRLFAFLLVGSNRKYRAIHATTVAQAMIQIANSDATKKVYESDEISALIK